MPKSHVIRKFTFLKYHFSQNSHFQNLIFHKIHIFKTLNYWLFLKKKVDFCPSVKGRILNSHLSFRSKFWIPWKCSQVGNGKLGYQNAFVNTSLMAYPDGESLNGTIGTMEIGLQNMLSQTPQRFKRHQNIEDPFIPKYKQKVTKEKVIQHTGAKINFLSRNYQGFDV